MPTLTNKNIILGVTGSIAAYKAAEITRLLIKAGAKVKVILTKNALEFITPLTLQTLSGNHVYHDMFGDNNFNVEHISLARWADLILIAPTTATTIARLAHGNAEELLSCVCLATTAPIWIAPAMNQQMWLNPITQNNLQLLKKYNHRILTPTKGEQACHEDGVGRLMEPQIIIDHLNNQYTNKAKDLNVVITAGPTREAIDSVRYLSNHSSGKMGYALAEAFANHSAKITLISGPTNITPPQHSKFIPVTNAAEMSHAAIEHSKNADIFIATAAVADYKAAQPQKNKLKKSNKKLTLELEPTIDILATITQQKNPLFIVGFAAETENLIHNATKKLNDKKLDMIIANQISEDIPFYSDDNAVTIINKDQQQIKVEKNSKQKIAEIICDTILSSITPKHHAPKH